MTTIAVIIVNWNGSKDTIECLTSLVNSEHDAIKMSVYVVDNHSHDDSIATIERFIASNKGEMMITLLVNSANRGFSGGNNMGISEALKQKPDYIVLLNNDTMVDVRFFNKILKGFTSEETSIVGPKIYFAKGYEYHRSRYKSDERGNVIWYAGGMIDWNNIYLSHRGVDEVDHGQYNHMSQTDFVSGCCMCIRSTLFGRLGLLDERYFMYLEDADFCMRAKRAGFIVNYNPKAYLWHKNAQSTGSPGSPLHQYFQTRNRLLFGFRYAPLRTKIALLRESVRLLHTSDIRKKAIVDFYLRRFGNVSSYQL